MTTLTLTADTARGETATRATKHRGNAWLIRRDTASALVELAPDLDITQFDWDVSQDNWEFVITIHRGTRASGPEHYWHFPLDSTDDGTWGTQEAAEKALLVRAGKYASKYVPDEAVCYWDAVKALTAVEKKYKQFLSFEENRAYRPKLMQNWGLDEPEAPWAVVWEEGSPDEWALKWGQYGKREDPTGLFMWPLCTFALGINAE